MLYDSVFVNTSHYRSSLLNVNKVEAYPRVELFKRRQKSLAYKYKTRTEVAGSDKCIVAYSINYNRKSVIVQTPGKSIFGKLSSNILYFKKCWKKFLTCPIILHVKACSRIRFWSAIKQCVFVQNKFKAIVFQFTKSWVWIDCKMQPKPTIRNAIKNWLC